VPAPSVEVTMPPAPAAFDPELALPEPELPPEKPPSVDDCAIAVLTPFTLPPALVRA
jgi:hypothetical protein